MGGYTKLNLRADVEDQAPSFGLGGKIEARMARVPLELEHSGVSYQRIAPGFRLPFAHSHKTQEEVYVVVSGSLRAKVGEDVLELGPFDALRVDKDAVRGFEGGPDGAELIAIGAPNTGPGDAELEHEWWSD
ncbi:MAG TPA: cupin domain-containing protein [Gaiellaceae bacterium]|nr:cupin domain-containing protein [Gaiellaceae bacterium]